MVEKNVDKKTLMQGEEPEKHNNGNGSIPIEQYKILFDVVLNLNDNVVKSVITIFVIFTAMCALVVQGINNNPEIKNLLFFNYILIFVFSYYLGYLRFRIRAMFEFAKIIEEGENFKYRGISSYEGSVRNKFFSTVGLFIVVIGILIIINTVLLVVL